MNGIRMIDCVEVLKVYDQCFREDVIVAELNIRPEIIAGCEVEHASCDILSSGEPNERGWRTIITQQLTRVKITKRNGTCLLKELPPYFSEVLLYGPAGTFASCELVNTRCDWEPAPGQRNRVLIRVRACKIIDCKGLVKVVIPSLGFAWPDPCRPTPETGWQCPPFPPFPGENF